MCDVLLAGIYDAGILRKMHVIDQILQQPVNDVIAMVEKKEIALDVHLMSTLLTTLCVMSYLQGSRMQTYLYVIDQILQQPVNDVIVMVEKKEIARDVHSAASQCDMSSMKRQKKKNEK